MLRLRARRGLMMDTSFFHTHFDTCARSKGQNAVASAAYRSASVLQMPDGTVADYTKKPGVCSDGLILPSGCNPRFAVTRQWLWEAAERAENRKNSTVARRGDLALPHVLSLQEKLHIGRQYAQDIAARYNVIVDLNFHNLEAQNPHVDVQWTTREFDGEKLTIKTRLLDDKDSGPREIAWLREQWGARVNECLQHYGSSIDHRSYKDQGIDKLAQRHLGRKAAALERQGIATDVGAYNRKVREHNRLVDEKDKLDLEIASLEAEIMEEDYVTRNKPPTETGAGAARQPDAAARAHAHHHGRGAGTDAPAVDGQGNHKDANHYSGRSPATRHSPLVQPDVSGTDATMLLADHEPSGNHEQNCTGGEQCRAIYRPAAKCDEFSRQNAKGLRRNGKRNQSDIGRHLQPAGKFASGQSQTQRRNPESCAAEPETARRSYSDSRNSVAPGGWDRLFQSEPVESGKHEKLAALAGALERRCRAIAGVGTMAALEEALWKQQWSKALTPVAQRDHAPWCALAQGIQKRIAGIAAQEILLAMEKTLLAEKWRFLHENPATSSPVSSMTSTDGIQTLVSKLSAQTTVAAINQELFNSQWGFLLRPPPLCLESRAGLMDFPALFRAPLGRLSGLYTTQALEAYMRANAGWQFLLTRNTGLLPSEGQNLAETRDLSRDMHNVISTLSGALTASAIREAMDLAEDDPASTLSSRENQHAP